MGAGVLLTGVRVGGSSLVSLLGTGAKGTLAGATHPITAELYHGVCRAALSKSHVLPRRGVCWQLCA